MSRLAVELRPGFVLKALDGQGVTLSHSTTTEHIDACTVVWCGGMRANMLAVQLPVRLDPMGRYACNNAVCDAYGLEMLPLEIDWYTTICDLGPWGAVYTEEWDRHLVSQGETAKATKRTINGERIYPPKNGTREELFRAAVPVVQAPPHTDRTDCH